MVGLITQIDANIAGSPKAKFSQFVMSVDIAGFYTVLVVVQCVLYERVISLTLRTLPNNAYR